MASMHEPRTTNMDSLNTEEMNLKSIANPSKIKDDSFATDIEVTPAIFNNNDEDSSDSDIDTDKYQPKLQPQHKPQPQIKFPQKQFTPASIPVISEEDSADMIDSEQSDDSGESVIELQGETPYVKPPTSEPLTQEEIRKRKFELLYKIKALAKKGIAQPRPVDFETPLDNVELTYNEMYDTYKRKNSVKLQRKMLVMAATFVEFMNTRYDPFDFKLQGWSESVYEGVSNEEYDEVLEELYEKYKTKTKMAPEAKILMMLGGSAIMHHTLSATFSPGASASMPKSQPRPQPRPQPTPPPAMSGPSGLDDILKSFKNNT